MRVHTAGVGAHTCGEGIGERGGGGTQICTEGVGSRRVVMVLECPPKASGGGRFFGALTVGTDTVCHHPRHDTWKQGAGKHHKCAVRGCGI